MRFTFDNNVCVLFHPDSDNLGDGWEETVICYPVLGDWELVVGFEVIEPNGSQDVSVKEWPINYIGHNRIVGNGVLEVVEWAAGHGHRFGTQTVGAMLPDKGLYVEHVWEYLQLRDARDIAAENAHGIGSQIADLEFERDELSPVTHSGRIEAIDGELGSLEADLERANAKHNEVGSALEAHVGKDPTFTVTD